MRTARNHEERKSESIGFRGAELARTRAHQAGAICGLRQDHRVIPQRGNNRLTRHFAAVCVDCRVRCWPATNSTTNKRVLWVWPIQVEVPALTRPRYVVPLRRQGYKRDSRERPAPNV